MMQYSRSFHFNLYIIFETKKEKEREKTIKLPTTCMRKSDIIYLEISTHVIHSLNNQNERRGEKFYYTFVANSATLVVSVYQRITADTSPDKTGVDNRYLF